MPARGTVYCLALSSPPKTSSRHRGVFSLRIFRREIGTKGCISRSTALAFSKVGFVEWAPGNSATARTRTVGTALKGERTPSCSAAEALRASWALELQRLPVLRRCEAEQGAAAGEPRSAPAASQSPLPLREKQCAPCWPHHVCRGMLR